MQGERIKSGFKRVVGIGFFKDAQLEQFPEHDVFQASERATGSESRIDASLSSINAFEQLFEKGYHSAPVYDKKASKYVGFLDTADLVTYVVQTLHKTSDPDVHLPPHFSSLKDMLVWVNRHVPDVAATTSNLSARNPFKSVPPNASLLDVIEILGIKGVKRVAVQDAVSGRITKLITQSSIVKYILTHDGSLSPLGDTTLEEAGLGLKTVKTVSLTSPAVRAFEIMETHHISSIPVIDHGQGDKMVASISDYDLRAMLTVKDFQLYGITIRELLNLIKPENPFRLLSVPKTATIASLFQVLCDNHIHRVYIHDELGLPIGVVTFKELLAHLLSRVRHTSMDWRDRPAHANDEEEQG
ncbi:hypothetical protein PTSG_11243 [Salpingoeca rosetta]|uniref:CBS domain-containing protein n=1 Tax=Salpingoeca rosetta (strain ATCC 50818 / BSB-021) TaxID=946362 RepID=F2USU9_SALR5|nr:uncharacterized protein PTSG_11243 [Salpingoeca rosetta]EGD81208.1 hypothetical protein PTSG_11243 [Salpingoeca rosetta]|eukprot:XP_004987742.1 hypothetical protein PTSG_11243 [Salpingoeca rosetta]